MLQRAKLPRGPPRKPTVLDSFATRRARCAPPGCRAGRSCPRAWLHGSGCEEFARGPPVFRSPSSPFVRDDSPSLGAMA